MDIVIWGDEFYDLVCDNIKTDIEWELFQEEFLAGYNPFFELGYNLLNY
jgi:hypothetical protein